MTAIAVLIFAIGSTGVLAEDPFKVGFVYIGPVGDHGWDLSA